MKLEIASHRNVVHLRPDGKITIEKVGDRFWERKHIGARGVSGSSGFKRKNAYAKTKYLMGKM